MSDTPREAVQHHVPALRDMSAERLVEGDVFRGVIHGEENRKGWATLESEGQPVLTVRHHDNTLTVTVQTPQGPSNLVFVRNDQVLIEHQDHPNAVKPSRS